MPEGSSPKQALRVTCVARRFHAYGTSALFERRAKQLSLRRNLILYLGIVAPLLVGSLALSFGKQWVEMLGIPVGLVLTVQLCVSLWALIAKWDDRYVYATLSMQANTKLFNAWDSLAKSAPADLKYQVKILEEENERQESSDLAQEISEKEKAFAMRASLIYFMQACPICGETPKAIERTDCSTCGNI